MDPEGRVLVIAGFHTGRANVASFFDVAEEQGLDVEEIYEDDAEGVRREWSSEENGASDGGSFLKKWLVLATLKRKL